ncbi:MAG: LLM class flavin-dependent oxidoreductase [Armatimonadota bacterium]|nr:LLM class flavin-dependent oxidoreductase [Armatimonadota bacterium]MDR7458924.1 LLM class flavin-dependent oxidoreductase [Armatimonadota bacterium]
MGLGFLGTPPVPRMVELAQAAEAAGFASVWVAETRLRRDGITAVAAIAVATRRVSVATGLVNVYTRGPVLLAQTAATLAELSGGRFALGVGAGSAEILRAQGIAPDRPFTRLREYVDVLRPLLVGQTVEYEGRVVRVRGARLEVVPPVPPPLYLGVTGPRGLRLAGRVADGVLLDAFVPMAYIQRAAEVVQAAAGETGRGRVDIAGIVMTAIAENGATARERMRAAIARYYTLFPTIAAVSGLSPDEVERLQRVTRQEGPRAGGRYLSDALVDAVCLAGTPEECRRGLQRFRAAGLDLPVLMTPDDPADLLEAFGQNATSGEG